MPKDFDFVPDLSFTRINVYGVGGEGGNAIDYLKKKFQELKVKTIGVNTDNQDLQKIRADKKILIGENRLHGRGTGANPPLAERIAEEEISKITPTLKDVDMAIVCCGLGGGTGSGAGPVVVKAAAKQNILTLAIVTFPFTFEGGTKTKIAVEYLKKIKEAADAVIVIPNWKLIKEKGITIKKAFEWGNEILVNSIEVISSIINNSHNMNVDFQDIKTVLENSKDAYISMAQITESMEIRDEEKGDYIVEELMNFPLVDADTIKNISKAVFFIEMNENADASLMNDIESKLKKYTKPDSMIIPGITFNENIKGIKATLIAGHFEKEDSEYYLENPSTSGDVHNQNYNKKVQNMDNPNNLFPPSMNRDLD